MPCTAFTADGEPLQPTEKFHLKAGGGFGCIEADDNRKTISSIFFPFHFSDSTDHRCVVSKSFCFNIFPIWLFPAVDLSFLFLFSHRV